jgi:hypothetical protein
MSSNSWWSTSGSQGLHGSALHLESPLATDPAMNEKLEVINAAIDKEDNEHKHYDPEKGDKDLERPFLLTHAFVIGLAMILVVVVEMACVAKVISSYTCIIFTS